ncbi:hypothetical protein D3C80_985440 [compost metagenome]
MTHGQFAQAGVQRILVAEGFHGATLDLLVDLVEQAADPAQGEVTEGFGEGEQADERGLVQLQAEGVFACQVFGAGSPFAEQGGEGETLAAGDLEGGFGARAGHVLTLTDHTALLDDVEVLDRAVSGLDDAVIGRIEAQLALFDEKRQVGILHLIEGWKALQELHGPLDVLHHCRFSCLGEGVHFAHEHYRVFVSNCDHRPCCFRPSWSVAGCSVPIGRKSINRVRVLKQCVMCQLPDERQFASNLNAV